MARRKEPEDTFVACRLSQFVGVWHVMRKDGTTVCGRDPNSRSVKRATKQSELDMTARCGRCWSGKYSCETELPPERQLSLFEVRR